MYFRTSVYFKTSEKKTSTDSNRISEEIFPALSASGWEVCFKGLVSHQEFAGSNSCWRPFFGTNRLDDLESFYNPSYLNHPFIILALFV
jgi:hypothetical protein